MDCLAPQGSPSSYLVNAHALAPWYAGVMEAQRKNLLKSYTQVRAATDKLARLVAGNTWPLPAAMVDNLLSRGAVVEGVEVECKSSIRRSPSKLSALAVCVVKGDIRALEKFVDAPFVDPNAFGNDARQALWTAINSRRLASVRTLVSRSHVMDMLPASEALSLLSNALSNDSIEIATTIMEAGVAPGVQEHEISGRAYYRGAFSHCRSAEAVRLLVARGVPAHPPAGLEDRVSDLAQILDLVGYRPAPEQAGGVQAMVELISQGYPLDNVKSETGESLAGNIARACYRMPATAMAPLVPLVASLLPEISSRHYYSPTGPLVLLEAGFSLDLPKVAKNWASWLSGSPSLDKDCLSRLLKAGMPGPTPKAQEGLWDTDEYGNDTGELDTDKCLLLAEAGVILAPAIEQEIADRHPELIARIERFAAKARARQMNEQTHPASSPPSIKRM